MSWLNCLFFAVRLYIRRARKGDCGYIVIRKSQLGMGQRSCTSTAGDG